MKKALLIFFVFLCNSLYSQVNLQTGAAQVSIPLYQYNDPANRLSLNINLNYTGGNGIKVSEVGGIAGTGWQLNYGGFISRIQHGEPDDQKQLKAYNYPASNLNEWINYSEDYYPNGYLYSEYDPSQVVTNSGALVVYKKNLPMQYTGYAGPSSAPHTFRNYKPAPQYLADREQDEFAFSFLGLSGKFVIGKNKQVKCITDNNLKISFKEADMSGSNILTTISQFTITDEAGIKYTFKDMELSEICKYEKLDLYNPNGTPRDPWNGDGFFDNRYMTSGNEVLNVLSGKATNKSIVNKWCLSEIENPLTGKKIVFNYSTYNIDYNGDVTLSGTKCNNKFSGVALRQRIKGIRKKIESIVVSPTEKVVFTYSMQQRKDISCEVFLDKVIVFYNNNVTSGWQFGFKYQTSPKADNCGNCWYDESYYRELYENMSDMEKRMSRLYLTSLQKIDKNWTTQNGYEFKYKPALPALFSLNQDMYGYYGQFFISDSYCMNGNFFGHSMVVKNLTNQSLPAGVATYHDPREGQAAYGILNYIKNPTGGTLTYEFESNYCNYNSSKVLVGGVRVKKVSQFDGISSTNTTEYKYTLENGLSSGWGYEPAIFANNSSTRVYRKDLDGNDNAAGFKVPQFAMNYAFHLVSSMGSIGSSAFIEAAGAAAMESFYAAAAAVVISMLYDMFAPEYKDIDAIEYSSTNYTANNALPIQYSRVEAVTLDASGQESGKTVYEFTDPSLRAIDVPALSFPYSAKPRLADWAYGLPKTISIYKKGSTAPIRKIINDYTVKANQFIDPNFLSRKWSPIKRTYTTSYLLYNIDASTTDIAQETYYPLTGHTELTKTTEYNYTDDGKEQAASTTYEYDNNYKLKKTTVTNAANETLGTLYKYPYNYTSQAALKTMVDSNLLQPVAVENYKTNADGSFLVGGAVSEFGTVPNGDIKTVNTYAFQNAKPIIAGIDDSYNNSVLVPQGRNYKLQGKLTYDNAGNIVQTEDAGGNKVVNLWGYNNSYIVARLIGTDYNTAKQYCTQSILDKPDNDQQLRDELNKLRNSLPNARIVTYTYDPLIGKTSETDINNKTTYYEYDGLGRIITVKDENGKVIKAFEYRYKQ